MLRDEAFNNKWQLYKMDIAGENYFVTWQEFLNHAEQQTFPSIYDHLSRAPIWLEKRFGINNKRVSHSNVKFGNEFLTETTLGNNDNTSRSIALSKGQIKTELEAWTPRNLNIFFLEFIINNEIAALEHPDNNEINSLISDEAMKSSRRLEHYYKNLLRVINDAHFECFEATSSHTVNAGHVERYDAEEEFKSLKYRYIPYLQEFVTAEHFHKLKSALQSGSLYTNDNHGIIINRELIDSIMNTEVPKKEAPVLTITSPDKPVITSQLVIIQPNSPRTIGIAIGTGTLLGLLTIGIIAAIIFTGGAAALLSTAIIAGILVAAGTTPIIAGLLTGAGIHAAHTCSTTAFIKRQMEKNSAHGEVVTVTSPSRDISSEPLTIIKSQPPQGEPSVQNPSPSHAPTPNASLR